MPTQLGLDETLFQKRHGSVINMRDPVKGR